jgi:hypothetical protein
MSTSPVSPLQLSRPVTSAPSCSSSNSCSSTVGLSSHATLNSDATGGVTMTTPLTTPSSELRSIHSGVTSRVRRSQSILSPSSQDLHADTSSTSATLMCPSDLGDVSQAAPNILV